MKTPNTITISIFICLLGICLACTVQRLPAQGAPDMYSPTNRILVKFTEQIIELPEPEAVVNSPAIIDRADILRSYFQSLSSEIRIARYRPQFQPSDTMRVNRQGQTIRSSDWSLVYRIKFNELVPFYDIKEELEQYEYVEWVDPPVMIEPLYLPDDFSGVLNQWNLFRVNAPHAWDITQGSSNIRIQILDDGIAPHSDINNKILNTGGNSVFGTHGLAVAGVAGTETDNGLGLASLGWETSLVTAPHTFPSATYDLDIAGYIMDSFEDESQYEAEIINCSFRTVNCLDFPVCSQIELYDFNSIAGAVEEALDEGRIIVAAAGNLSDGLATVPYTLWPADYDGVISVSATNSNDEFPNGYNYGNHVNLSAPGVSVPSLIPNNDYGSVSGTSFAVPHVAATVALMLDVNPSLTRAQITSILESTAEKVGQYSYDGNGWNQYMGHGRLNAYEAVKQAVPTLHNESFTSSTTLPGAIRITGTASISSGVTLTVGSGNVAIIDGTINATNSTLAVNGRLIIEDSATISGVDIDVSSSGELIIREGVSLSFDNGQGIVAYGPVNINGTGNNRTILQASGTSWTGVHLHGSGSSLSHTDIQGAGNGVSIFNTSNISLSYLDVSNNSTAGIHLVNSSGVSINNVRSVDNSLYGILVDGNNNYHWSDNAFRDSGEGLRMIGGALLDNITRTRLADNWNGMVIREDSWINIATSSFVNSLGRHAVSIENSTANARHNWWEQAPPDPMKFQEATGGTINYSSWRTQDPIPGVQFIPGNDDSVEIFASDESGLPEVIRNAGDLRQVVTAITEDPSEQLQQLDQQNWQIAPSAVPWLDVLRMELLQIEGNHKSAESIGLGLLKDISLNQSVRQTAARRLFYSYLLGLKDYSKAAETLALLKELESPEFPDVTEEILADLLEFYGGLTVAEPGQLQFTSASDDAILTNYPNPFNPSTIIRYQLPENGPVTLQVFDLLGRQVAELVNEVQSAGMHSIHFNAEHLSSGLYIYRLQTGEQILTRQMSLIK